MLNHQGFTLVELLVVMAILSVMSMTAYRLIQITLTTQVTLKEQQQRLRELQLGFYLLKNDLAQIQRAPLPLGMLPLQAEPFDEQAIKSGKEQVLFRLLHTQSTWGEGAYQVDYRLKDNTLWQVQLQQGKAFYTPILHEVLAVKLRFSDSNQQQYTTWQKQNLPALFELFITHKRYGELPIVERL